MGTGPQYVGIDLGTTNSTAAVFDGDTVTLVRNSAGATLTPSVVRIDGRGTVTVGARARRFLESDPDNTRSEFKRLMGTSQTIAFPTSRTTKKPEELSALVLAALAADIKEHLGFVPARAVVSVPALFELPQSAATSEAARIAGFERVELIQEPVASALAAGFRAGETLGKWLVYDLGGGTFDVSLLETRDGLLRVVGHDGDNFLGGRDFDWAVVDWVLAELERTEGVSLRRSEPSHAAAIRKLKLAVEEAKIELSRSSETSVALPAPLVVDGASLEVDVSIDRTTLNRLSLGLIDRSVEVVRRLLSANGIGPTEIDRLVLVGGPTVMPILRERLRETLGIPFAEGLDPMTLVAQGAALYAATAGLDARKVSEPQAEGRRVWLQYPAMSSDLSPHVVGRFVDEGAAGGGVLVRVSRSDGGFTSVEAPIDEEGAFVLTVELLPRKANVFRLEARSKSGANIPVQPSSFTIVQGLTVSDPPLSRTVGVALADDTVRVFFERGAPLPARRTFVHHAVESVARGSSSCLLRIPIVQGELERAHLCRLVGALDIGGTAIKASLPSGSPIEITLELDRGGFLSARAFVPSLGQVFEQVAHLLVPDATPESLDETVRAMKQRMAELRTDALKRDSLRAIGKLLFIETALPGVLQDIAAARGGDADAAQKARRTLLDLDGVLEEVEADERWPELDEEARAALAYASQIVARHGSTVEQKLLAEAMEAVAMARARRQPVELERQLRVVRAIRSAAAHRDPRYWEWRFEHAASVVDEATDLAKAQALVREGRALLAKGDVNALPPVVEKLWDLMPVSAKDRRLGYDSGVR